MTQKSIHDLGHLQKAIMETVWELGEATARQVLERVSRKKPLAYTSVLSIMQRLENMGWLKHRVDGRTYIYQPALSRKHESIRSLRKFIDRVFHGDSALLFQHLLEDEDLSKADLTVLREMIDKKRKEKRA